MYRLLLGILVCGVAIVVGLSLYTFYLYTHPRRYTTNITPADLALPFEDVSLTTEDGISLSGWMVPNNESRSIIIICHGYPADKGDVLAAVAFLHKDHNLLFFDFRAHGKSGGSFTTFGSKEKLDFLAALDYTSKAGFKEIGALGFSMGGSVILLANSPKVSAAVTDSAFADLEDMTESVYQNFGPLKAPFVFLTNIYCRLFLGNELKGISPVKEARNLAFPLFIIHAERDQVVPVESAYALENATPESSLWIIERAQHGGTFAVGKGEYETKVREFFRDHLR